MFKNLPKTLPARNWRLIGFWLSLPTVFGWLGSIALWVGTPQSLSLAGGAILSVIGLPASLYGCFRQPGKKRLAILGLLFNTIGFFCLCAMLFVAFDGRARGRANLTISERTTRITRPLRPDGYPDYLGALNATCAKGVSPDDNAMVLMMHAVGPQVIPEELLLDYFQMLGMEPPPNEGSYFVTWPDHIRDQMAIERRAAPNDPDWAFDRERHLTDQFRQALVKPWSAALCPVLAEWLQTNQAPLDMLIAASKRSKCFAPLLSDGEIPILGVCHDHIQRIRNAGTALVLRAMLRLSDGQIDRAKEDLLACLRLARLIEKHPFVSDRLKGWLLESDAARGMLALFHYGPKIAAEAKSLDRLIQELPDFPDLMGQASQEWRFGYLDCLCAVIHETEKARNPLNRVVGQAVVDPTLSDWDGAFRNGNAWFDRIDDALGKEAWTDRTHAARSFEEAVSNRGSQEVSLASVPQQFIRNPRGVWGRIISENVLSLTLPNFLPSLTMRDRATTRSQLFRLASAINVYRAEHNAYPQELAALKPAYVASLPVDLYHGNEFRYRADGEGYTVYSLGPNGRDDRGRNYHDGNGDGKRDDDDIAIIVPPKVE